MRPNRDRLYKKPDTLRSIAYDIIALLILSGFLVFIYWLYNYSTWFALRNFNVSSATGPLKHVSAKEINQALAPYRQNNNLLKIRLSSVKKSFEQLSWIEKVQVQRVWPHTINIQIYEHLPIARWQSGTNLLMDRKGILFSGESDKNLVLFKAPPRTEKLVFTFYRQAQPYIQMMGLHLKQLEYTNRSAWIFYTQEGPILFAGRKEMIQRLQSLALVWPKLLAQHSGVTIEEIHLEYRSGFAVKYGNKKEHSPIPEKGNPVEYQQQGRSVNKTPTDAEQA